MSETKDRLVKLVAKWRGGRGDVFHADQSQHSISFGLGYEAGRQQCADELSSILAQMDETPAPAETVVIGEEHATGLGHLGRVVSSEEWFRPADPMNFMLVCCDCGLTHRVEQRVVDGVAEFRWVNSPDDTVAHRHDERNDFPVFRAAAGLSTDPDTPVAPIGAKISGAADVEAPVAPNRTLDL